MQKPCILVCFNGYELSCCGQYIAREQIFDPGILNAYSRNEKVDSIDLMWKYPLFFSGIFWRFLVVSNVFYMLPIPVSQ